jgi:hypothetical protein
MELSQTELQKIRSPEKENSRKRIHGKTRLRKKSFRDIDRTIQKLSM